ncbi:adaptor protein MecA [Vagococcus intermedius]|uniref:Adapter protein MecA n=1 Tax=Vagococcus intermedius TaxID=2991418 RepID=A0AAF0CV75_9ENTE|nr:adaptor protein MecA [Vagococcus intermedius]WEG73550.1 adaptor protein MecA [Vagococcus intermedius]WEG75632.1 adaptor protein MecA [Vagococcus intermedius]
MEMERINENTIRVLIENEDLEARGITFLDLLGNHKQIESFFYSILEEVDIDEQFQETDAVTFQVLPNRNGLELFISKNVLVDGENDFPEIGEILNQDNFSDFIKSQIGEGLPISEPNLDEGSLVARSGEKSTEKEETEDGVLAPTTIETVVRLASFEDLIVLAHRAKFENMTSDLYRMSGEGDVYYLHLTFDLEEMTEEQVYDELGLVLEFAALVTLTPEVLEEYGQLVMERSALEQTKHYFKK